MTIMVPNSKNGQPTPLWEEVKFWLAIIFIAAPFVIYDRVIGDTIRKIRRKGNEEDGNE